MTSALESIKEQLNDYWSRLEKRNKRNLLFIIASVVLAIVIIFILFGRKDYVVLYSGLSDREAAEIYTILKEANAQPKMSGTSSILVPKAKEPELRMQLTMEGYPKSGFNYDLYFEGNSFGQTDDEMQKRWIVQLQERLGQSVRFLDGVEDAVVTIAMPKVDSFVLKEDEVPVTASVIILPKVGYEITAQQAKSIEQLIATSIPGLERENISIIDNKMDILNVEGATDTQIVTEQIKMQQQLEDRIRAEIKELLESVFGYGKIKIAVNLRLNFDKKVKESIVFEPVVDDSGIVISQELLKERINNAGLGGILGETSNTTQYPEVDRGDDSTSNKEHKKINYEVNEIKEKIEEEQGKVDQLSIAVVIGNDGLDQQTLYDVRELVATAMGTDLDRVAVQSWKFNTDMQQDLLESLKGEKKDPWPDVGKLLITIVAAGIFMLAIVIALKRMIKPRELIIDDDIQEVIASGETDNVDIELEEQNEIKKQLERFAAEQPEEVAQLLRAWLGED